MPFYTSIIIYDNIGAIYRLRNLMQTVVDAWKCANHIPQENHLNQIEISIGIFVLQTSIQYKCTQIVFTEWKPNRQWMEGTRKSIFILYYHIIVCVFLKYFEQPPKKS